MQETRELSSCAPGTSSCWFWWQQCAHLCPAARSWSARDTSFSRILLLPLSLAPLLTVILLYLFVFILLPLLLFWFLLLFFLLHSSSCSVSFALCTSSTPVLPSILGPRLGLTIQNCWVSSISNPLAAQYGWQAGASGFLQNPSVYAESTVVFALCFLIDKLDRRLVSIPCTCSRMQVGDHILQVNGHPVSNMQQLSEEIRSAK